MAHREILFRGKNKVTEKWVYGSFLHLNVGRDYICDGTIWIGTLQPCKDEVIPESVGRYTGLSDKNGKKIFEGDVVRFEDIDGEMVVCVVLWGAYGGRWELDAPVTGNRFAMSFYDVVVEVIGNRFDDPELLEDQT